jgi:hypothetical protein
MPVRLGPSRWEANGFPYSCRRFALRNAALGLQTRPAAYSHVSPSGGIATGRSADLIRQLPGGTHHASRRGPSVRAGLAYRSG